MVMRMESLPRAPRWCASSPRIAGTHGKRRCAEQGTRRSIALPGAAVCWVERNVSYALQLRNTRPSLFLESFQRGRTGPTEVKL